MKTLNHPSPPRASSSPKSLGETKTGASNKPGARDAHETAHLGLERDVVTREMGEQKRRRRQAEPTDKWEQLKLLCRWPEQSANEEIRPLVLFGLPVAERAEETGSSERTPYRRISRFESEGMDSLFVGEGAKHRTLPR